MPERYRGAASGGAQLPGWFRDHLRAVTGRRSRIVIEHILRHGFVTTEELGGRYGYGHPPRAARDVREQGVPLETFYVTATDGRRIAAYRFGNLDDAEPHKLGGRAAWPSKLKDQLVEADGGRCAICLTPHPGRELQIDHRVPYEVGGDAAEPGPESLMLLCGSCNRAKSWSCEHCDNLTGARAVATCERCYWATPNEYDHVGLRPIRRVDLVWTGDEVEKHDSVARDAEARGTDVADFIKAVLDERGKRGG